MSDTPTPTMNPAQSYQDYYGPAIFEPLADTVLALQPPPESADVLDIACGTGILTRRAAALAGHAARVVGVDINPAMIEVARTLPVLGGASIDFRVGDGTALDLGDDEFDISYCQQGLQFFPDRVAGAREMRRVLRPGGTAVIAVWQGIERHPFFADLIEIEAPRLHQLGAGVDRDDALAPFSFGDPDALRSTLLDAGFRRVDIATDTVLTRFTDAERFVERLEYAYAAVVPAFAADPAAFRRYLDAITADTEELVSAYRDGDHVLIPMHANLAVAT
jgi:ubiquinone/menaquinone biosynthesis C-methylase UbiE